MPTTSLIYYYAYQSGEVESLPVVLIHGAGGHHLIWPPQVRRIPGYRIYAPDLPGHGKSGGLGRQNVLSYAEKLIEWMDAAGINRAAFVGHSMGGAIAQTLAVCYPERTAALGLISTGARLGVDPDILENAASPTTLHKAVNTLMERFFGLPMEPGTLKQIEAGMYNLRHSVVYGDLLACSNFDMLERLGAIACPALVICGSEDKLTPVRYAQYLAGEIPAAKLEIIPEAGHMVMLEKPDEVTSILKGFLDSVPYQAGD